MSARKSSDSDNSIAATAKRRRRIPAALFRPDCSLLLVEMELKGHLHELGNLLPTDLGRRELHTGERILHGGGERRVV
jgi:hypothetical protein